MKPPSGIPESVQEQRARPFTSAEHCYIDRRLDGDQAGCSAGDCTCACPDCCAARRRLSETIEPLRLDSRVLPSPNESVPGQPDPRSDPADRRFEAYGAAQDRRSTMEARFKVAGAETGLRSRRPPPPRVMTGDKPRNRGAWDEIDAQAATQGGGHDPTDRTVSPGTEVSAALGAVEDVILAEPAINPDPTVAMFRARALATAASLNEFARRKLFPDSPPRDLQAVMRQALVDAGLLPSPETAGQPGLSEPLNIDGSTGPQSPAASVEHDEDYKARIRGYFPGPLPAGLLRPLRPGEGIELQPELPRVARPLFEGVEFKAGPIPELAHPGELVIGIGPADAGLSEVVVAFSDPSGFYVLDRGRFTVDGWREVVLKAKLPERPVVSAGADNFTASQLKRRRDRLERRLAHLQARTADRDPRTVQYDTAEASALQTALALFDDAIAVRAPVRRWLRDQAASIDPDLPAAELDEAQLRGVVGVELLRLRRELEVARAESEANNARIGEVVAERAALRRDLDAARVTNQLLTYPGRDDEGQLLKPGPGASIEVAALAAAFDQRADGEPDPEPGVLARLDMLTRALEADKLDDIAGVTRDAATALRQTLAVAARFKRLARQGSNLPDPSLEADAQAGWQHPPCSLCKRTAAETEDGKPCRGRCIEIR